MAMVQYAESMVKLDNNAVFWLMCPQEEQEDNNNKAKLRPALYVRTNAGKNRENQKQQEKLFNFTMDKFFP
jgi:hypothetical protein